MKSYNFNQKLTYRTFSPQWYEVTILVNESLITGYIHKDDVGKTADIKTLRGIAAAKQTFTVKLREIQK